MKKKIMVDLDEVIVNQDGWLYVVNSYLNTKYTTEDIKDYYIQDLVPKEKMDDFVKYFETQNTYDYCELNEGCYEVLKELSDKYDVYICSAYLYRDDIGHSANFLKYKFEFLRRNLPFLDPGKYIFTDDKSIINCDIKIDDKIDNLNNANTKLLFTCYHNKGISNEELTKNNITRVNSWYDIKQILL